MVKQSLTYTESYCFALFPKAEKHGTVVAE